MAQPLINHIETYWNYISPRLSQYFPSEASDLTNDIQVL